MEDLIHRVICQSVFHRHLILEAGAGTGKTATLVARILCWSIGPGWEKATQLYENTIEKNTLSHMMNHDGSWRKSEQKQAAQKQVEIDEVKRQELEREQQNSMESAKLTAIASLVVRRVVAITFTEAAAAEMSERVAEGLLQLSSGNLSIVGMYPQLLLHYIAMHKNMNQKGNQKDIQYCNHVFPNHIDDSYASFCNYIEEVCDGHSLLQHKVSTIQDIYQSNKNTTHFDEIDRDVLECIQLRAQYLRSVSDQFIVRTIHAYCRRILSQFPLEGHIHPKFQVDPDGKKIRECVIRVLLIEIERIFSKTDEQFQLFQEFFSYHKTIDDVTEVIIKMLSEGVQKKHIEQFSRDVLFSEYKHIIQKLQRIIKIVTDIKDCTTKQPKLPTCIDAFLGLQQILEHGFSLEMTKENMQEHEMQLQQWSELYKKNLIGAVLKKWTRNEFSVGIQGYFSDHPEIQEELVTLSQQLSSYMSNLKYYKPRLIQVTHQILAPLFQLCEREKRRLGLLTFTELLTETTELLEKNTYITKQIQNGIDLLLVDEFQDTSAVQCRLVTQIVNLNQTFQNAKGSTPILFIVGDPKQSIYGWRQADISAYFDFCTKISQSQLGFEEQLRLTCNFRSRPVILDEVATCMNGLMEAKPGFQPSFVSLHPMRNPLIWDEFLEFLREKKPIQGEMSLQKQIEILFSSFLNEKYQIGNLSYQHTSENNDKAGVQHWITWAFDSNGELILNATNQANRSICQELEAKFVVDDIVRQKQKYDCNWSSFAILVRKMTDIDDILNELRRRNVPYMVSNDRNYYRRREIIELVSLLRIIFDPSDLLSTITFLRSAHVGLPDFALMALWQLGFPYFVQTATGSEKDAQTWKEMFKNLQRWEFVLDDIPRAHHLQNWKTRLDEQIRQILMLRTALMEMSVEEFVVAVKRRMLFSLTESSGYQGVYRLANIDKLCTQLREAMINDDGNWFGVLETLKTATKEVEQSREARPKEAGENAVQILSIHKSKGLDFDSVYVLQIHKSNRGDSEMPTFVSSETSWSLFGALTLSAIASLQKSEMVEQYENVRLLYVAMTRAKNRLIVSGVHPRPSSKGIQYKDIPVESAESFVQLLMNRYKNIFPTDPYMTCLDSQKHSILVPLPSGQLPIQLLSYVPSHLLQEFSKTKMMTTTLIGLIATNEQGSTTEISLPELSRIQSEACSYRKRLISSYHQSQRPISQYTTHMSSLMSVEDEYTLHSTDAKGLIALYLHGAVSKLCALLWLRRKKSIDWQQQKFFGQRMIQNMGLGSAMLDTQELWMRLLSVFQKNIHLFPARPLVGYDIPLQLPILSDQGQQREGYTHKTSVFYDDYRMNLLFEEPMEPEQNENNLKTDEVSDIDVRNALVLVELSMIEDTSQVLHQGSISNSAQNSPAIRAAQIIEKESGMPVHIEIWSLFTGEVFRIR